MAGDLILPLERFRRLLRPPARLLGLDVGRRRIGLAISDPAWRVATALDTVHRSRLKADLEAIGRIVAEWEVKGFVCGLPVGDDGRLTRRAQAVRQFARDLVVAVPLPLCFIDETLTSAETEEELIRTADLSRARRARVVDKLAAQRILEAALARLAG
ncbi:MAG: putative pre-16S rRNA nuclease [Rhodothalassiaceae bacterium]|nr:MAG: putative pre-16S rRNA nuclease [Rhodothalassiaceae bacterium]